MIWLKSSLLQVEGEKEFFEKIDDERIFHATATAAAAAEITRANFSSSSTHSSVKRFSPLNAPAAIEVIAL